MHERILRMGRSVPLTAIECVPADFDVDKPAVLILNSGLMHHVGTSRFSVKLARALADRSVYSVRFDFSGIGDSAARSGNLNFKELMTSEVIEVINHIEEKYKIHTFVSYGLCSGADASFYAAQLDKRIIGICQIDPLVYRHWSWFLRHYGARIFSLDTWLRFIKRLLGRNNKANEALEPTIDLGDGREIPDKSSVNDGFAALIANNVSLYTIITHGQYRLINHPSQYTASLTALKNSDLKIDFFPECGHVIAEPIYQDKLNSLVVKWVTGLCE